METIDVAILTKNSQRMLRECLDSVYLNVPVRKLIVVDGYSTDATADIVADFQKKHGNVIFIQTAGTRGSARQIATQHVKSDWFMFVDADVILSKDWFVQAVKLLREDMGAIWGIEIWSVLKDSGILPFFERVTLKIFEKRGGTHDMLIRKKTVEDIKIPYKLDTYEDGFIKDWIERKDYKVLGVYEPYCIHFRSEVAWTVQKNLGQLVSDLKYAVRRPRLLLPYGFYSFVVTYQIALGRFKRKRRGTTL
jgi:glycosyltransferase involved in cell wall biosynthesis